MRFSTLVQAASYALPILSCDDCYPSHSGQRDIHHTRLVRRMQPEAQNATALPKAPLAWGQINFLHTTDTHGWLAGHLKEQNYGADWGDYASFVRHMRRKADRLGVDLLLVDCGDQHDGNGLSDATNPIGLLSDPIFQEIDYDLATIGNHELYVSEVAYLQYYNYSRNYGERYITSNVQIRNPATGQFEYIGRPYRYFTTTQGLRIMAFGVLFDFRGNSNVSRVIPAANMTRQQWFLDAVNHNQTIDLFVVTGHNPARGTERSSTIDIVYEAIRALRPNIPIQMFGGHNHRRDFVVYDTQATALGSGRYCETLGWLSMSGVNSSTFHGSVRPAGVPNPTRPGIASNSTLNATAGQTTYSRRYLDWNRLTFAYHAEESQDHTFDLYQGLGITDGISETRRSLNLSSLYGCAPQTWCQNCAPFLAPGNIYSLLQTAMATVIVNESRADQPRFILTNTGSIRFDLVQGPFTYDDSFIVSPFQNNWEYIPEVPYSIGSQLLEILNAGPPQKKRRSLSPRSFGFEPMNQVGLGEECANPPQGPISPLSVRSAPKFVRRQEVIDEELTPGYVTQDDFGNDGDNTSHRPIPRYPQLNDVQANASLPLDGSDPETVDIVFVDFVRPFVLNAMAIAGANYTAADVALYLPENVTSNMLLPDYARLAWDRGPSCPVGNGVGFDTPTRRR